jgi:hypothetical protein
MKKKAVSNTTPTVSPEQLAAIEQQRMQQAQAYEQERTLLQQQNQQQTSAMQAMLTVYGKQVEDLTATRNQQQAEQQQLLETQKQQQQLIEADKVRTQADMTQQQGRTSRYANRASAVLSNRRAAKNTASRVFSVGSGSTGQIFGKRGQL